MGTFDLIRTRDLLQKTREGGPVNRGDLLSLLAPPAESTESLTIMSEARHVSEELTPSGGEVHALLFVNSWPCDANCACCPLAAQNGLVATRSEITEQDVVGWAHSLEAEGAAAIHLKCTCNYPMKDYLRRAEAVRDALCPETLMVAHVPRITGTEALDLARVGFGGACHSLRLREGTDSVFPPDSRIQTVEKLREAGLPIGTMLEPVGPEHTNEELADAILACAKFVGGSGGYAGVARRTALMGSALTAKFGMIGELRLAQLLAITRLTISPSVRGLCLEEPLEDATFAGVNVLFAGALPGSPKTKTEHPLWPNTTVHDIFSLYHGVNTTVWAGPSLLFRDKDETTQNASMEQTVARFWAKRETVE